MNSSTVATASTDDPYRWLEDLDGTDAVTWVRQRNGESAAALTEGERFTALRDEIRRVLDADERIPLPVWHGEHLYNLWKDAAHPRGLWRRTTLERYRSADPDWDVLLDLDALATAEDENWVWQGVDVLRPDGGRCLLSLSRGGSDASVVREFDLATRQFVPDGFGLPAAKSYLSWIDIDRVYVATDFGPDSLTTSGYPRIVKEWRRGTPLAAATTVYAGEATDVSVWAYRDPTPGFVRDLVGRSIDFFNRHTFLRTAGGDLVPIDIPLDAEPSLHREWLVLRLRSAWSVAGTEYPPGALLAADFDGYLAGRRDLVPLFLPEPHTSLSYHTWTRNHLILTVLDHVRSRQEVLTPGPGTWTRTTLAVPTTGPDDFRRTDIVDTNPDHSDEYLLTASGFLEPATLAYGSVGGPAEILRTEPAFFDATGLSVRQFFATSADGTQVPYFVVGRADAGAAPTLLSGYGGFEIPRLPSYSAILGRGWLARGGTYVLANIRGGGEYGPQWHRAAMRERRPRAYEDFAAVAQDLVRRGHTTPRQLGVEGGSNGGLLTGVMLTSYPDLFGAVVSQVPLLDMRRYHELLAGASWIAEYGDPDDQSDWAYLRGFSPYHNVHNGQKYPPALFVTSTRDDRVHPGHARKMVARMLEQGHEVTYYENIEGGHGAAADNAQLAYKWALVLEFLWRTLGVG